jgi:hypothetical protein
VADVRRGRPKQFLCDYDQLQYSIVSTDFVMRYSDAIALLTYSNSRGFPFLKHYRDQSFASIGLIAHILDMNP